MSRRTVGFLVFAVLVSAVCVRLGFWQLRRLSDRRATNAMLTERLSAAPTAPGAAMRDSATARFRRATASGTYDFANEFAVASRTHQGSPGVHLITPLRIPGSDTALLVNRGWVYAADAMSADFRRWVEPETATVAGYLLEVGGAGRGAVSTPTNPRTVRRLDLDSIATRLPYPVAPFLLVQTIAARSPVDSAPARVTAPVLDEGPHLGYAIQWFAFALIGLVGGGVVVVADRRAGGRRQLAATAPLRRARGSGAR